MYITPEYLVITSVCVTPLHPPPIKQSIPLFDILHLEAKRDSTFTRWAHRERRLSSMNALIASASKADVWLERKLRYGFLLN